jgi:hypothetical protein
VIHDGTQRLQNLKMQIFVMPAWIDGIQVRKDASGNIHGNRIPALHAGMTQSRRSA